MAFSANDVKKLREMTGVGMMDCKKALTASDGDMDKAIEFLREKGMAAAQKKAGKVAAEGMSYACVSDKGVGVVVEVNSQTDFVAANDIFQNFVKDIASVIAEKNPATVEDLNALTYPGTDRSVTDVTNDRILSIGENLKIRRFARYDTGVNVPYIHAGGKVGVLVNMEVEGISPADVQELGKDIAMQICAMNPMFLRKEDVDQSTLDKEREIQLKLAQDENAKSDKPKPDQIIVRMVEGRMNKYYEENCLLEQAFVKESKISVGAHVAAVAKEKGGKITVNKFTRYATGEGIEKQVSDLAAEVAAALNN